MSPWNKFQIVILSPHIDTSWTFLEYLHGFNISWNVQNLDKHKSPWDIQVGYGIALDSD